MNIDNKISSNFTQKEIAAAIQIWNRAAVSLLDIRHNLISPGDPLLRYRMPASTFVYAGGKAEISLNDTTYGVERLGLFHGGKGTELSIRPVGGWLEYYMVLYKAAEPPVHKKEYLRLLEQVNPFGQLYGFAPDNPLFFAEQLRRMYEKWNGPTPLNLFYGKSAFYQLVYEIYEELDKGRVSIFEPDMIALAQRYLDENYGEAVSIQNMREVLGISNSHFHRLFTARTGQSPQEYLISRRLDATKQYLSDTDCTLREIAAKCGFSDELSLMRMFRKHVHMSTTEYRDICASQMGYLPIDNILPFPYNEKGQVSLDELKGKGGTFMLKQMRSKAVIAAALSLMLMLSACSTTPANTGGADSAPTSATTSEVTETEVTEPVEEGTRTISTVMGDVELSMNPKRIIVQYLMGDLVALNVIPVGISTVNEGAVYERELANVTVVGIWEFEPESIMELEPDLIILASDTQYDDMSKIAPTVLVPYGSMTTEERLTFLGEVLNRPDEAKAALAQYEAAVSEGKVKLVEAGLSDITVSAMQVTDELISVAGNKHALGTVLYDELGLKAPKAVQTDIIDAGEYWGGPSMEVLSNYCGDYVFHLGNISDSISGNAVWKSIPAVNQGNVMVMNSALTYYTDISSATAMVNNVVEQLLNTQNK